MSLETQGKLYEVFQEQQVSDKFKKREFVLEIPDGSYTQYCKFQLTQDKCSLLDQFQKGQDVKVMFNLSGKPFTKNGETMYFTNLQAWRIEPAKSNEVTDTAAYQSDMGNPYQNEVENELPF